MPCRAMRFSSVCSDVGRGGSAHNVVVFAGVHGRLGLSVKLFGSCVFAWMVKPCKSIVLSAFFAPL